MTDRTAVILAAGIGRRLGEFADNKPKCLLQFGGSSLLRRHLQTLAHYRVRRAIVVTGYQAVLIEREIDDAAGAVAIDCVHNPDYTSGSVVSLLLGLEAVETATDVILMDADVLYDHRIMGSLLDSGHENCFLLDRDFIPGAEPVKLCVRGGRLVEFRKQIEQTLEFDFQGESVGFFRFAGSRVRDLIAQATRYLTRGDSGEAYEECIRDLLLADPELFAYEDITGYPWIEIDFPEDVMRAKTEILPALTPVLS